MTSPLCQKCGEGVYNEFEAITYHKDCWVDFQQELIAVVEKRQWHKLGETTEYYEEDK